MKLSEFLDNNATRLAHAEGSKMPLDDDQYLVIAGPDSEIGRKATAERLRIEPGSDDIPGQVRKIYSTVVIDWSFDEPISSDLVQELFIDYPWSFDQTVAHFSKYINFTKGRLKNSENTQNSK